MVVCPFCGAMVTRASSVVQAEGFARVHRELLAEQPLASGPVHIGGVSYRKLFQIGTGEHTDVFLGERISPVTERVVIKLAREDGSAKSMQNEIEVLTALQTVQTQDAAYYSRRVPQLVQDTPGLRWCCGMPLGTGAALRRRVAAWRERSMPGISPGSGAACSIAWVLFTRPVELTVTCVPSTCWSSRETMASCSAVGAGPADAMRRPD